jgi:acyl-CoA reductase-like NAD-dependent aldehyde dehydrogenase
MAHERCRNGRSARSRFQDPMLFVAAASASAEADCAEAALSGSVGALTNPMVLDQVVAPFVNGALSDSGDEATLAITNPANGLHLLTIPSGCAADVDRAVASARRAFDDGRWSETPPSFRKGVLARFADLIGANAGPLDMLDAGEMGKPVSETFANAASAAGVMRFYAEAVDKLFGDVLTSDRHSLVAQRRVPRGVVAAITPWNFPTVNAVRKIAPALAAGNCVVLKPSELASRSAMRLAQLALEAGLPSGVLNIVPGLGETVGRALALHGDVDMVTFTGSTDAGKLIVRYAGESNLKAVMAECGGKSPQIVFADGVDLAAASESIARFLLTNQGQVCSVGSRLLVQRSIEAELVERIAARMGEVVIGDPLDRQTTFGPLASAKQCERVMSYIETARAEGAQLVCGGRRTLRGSGGYFVEPTLFRAVAPAARIAQEEIFGPVLTAIPFTDEREAIRIANATMYGLAAYVWTADLSRGMRMAKAIRSSVWINAVAPRGEGAGHAASFEPVGQSGVGVEGGLAGMESYLRRQLVCFNHG